MPLKPERQAAKDNGEFYVEFKVVAEYVRGDPSADVSRASASRAAARVRQSFGADQIGFSGVVSKERAVDLLAVMRFFVHGEPLSEAIKNSARELG